MRGLLELGGILGGGMCGGECVGAELLGSPEIPISLGYDPNLKPFSGSYLSQTMSFPNDEFSKFSKR